MYVSGASSTTPLRPYGEQSFYVASLFSAVGILMALIKRRSTGKGNILIFRPRRQLPAHWTMCWSVISMMESSRDDREISLESLLLYTAL